MKYPAALILEDNPVEGRLIFRYLERMGFEVVLTTKPEDFFKAYKTSPSPFQLCAIDLNVTTALDGFAVIKVLRAHQCRSVIFVISGESRIDALRKALDSGADDYILKPFDYQNLSIRLSRYFSSGIDIVGGDLHVLPKPKKPFPGVLSFEIELLSIDEEALLFKSNHLFLKDSWVSIDSPVLESVLGAKGPHAFQVLKSDKEPEGAGYSILARLGCIDKTRAVSDVRKSILDFQLALSRKEK